MALEYKANLRKEHGKYVCPHNEECRCVIRECWKCGWNPTVAKARLFDLEQRLKEAMA